MKHFIFLKEGGQLWDIVDIDDIDEIADLRDPGDSNLFYGDDWNDTFNALTLEEIMRECPKTLKYLAKSYSQDMIEAIKDL